MPHNETPRVGYVVKRYPRYSETFIVNEILAHEKAGLEIEIFALRPPVDTHFQNLISAVRAPVTYLTTGKRMSQFWKDLTNADAYLHDFWHKLEFARDENVYDVHQAAALARLACERNLTHLHAHFASSATNVARLAARFAGLPYTFTAHAKDIFHETVDESDLRRKLLDAANVVTVSDFNLNFLRETYGAAAERVERIYNGLNLADFPFESPSVRPPRIVSVGRLVEKKGFGVLIDACEILRKRGVKFDCSIIGTGELENELREQIEHLKIGEIVELAGARPQSELRELLQNTAVFAAPCVIGKDGNRDGLPTVLLEAMSLGTPCVSTDVTGIPEILKNGETGLMVAQNNALELADALEKLLNDADLRVRLAKRARALIEENFDIEKNSAQIRRLFTRAGNFAASAVL